MKKIIATTTINSPTKALKLFQDMSDWELVVAGDKKTPADFQLSRGTYLTPEMQEKMDPELSNEIGWNCIQRRNFAVLWAYQQGADIVAVVDDDNIPYDGWGKNLLIGNPVTANFYESNLPAFDPVGATNHRAIWHRGFPLQWLSKRDYSKKSRREVVAHVQADFWNGDPDIDAFCRMEHAPDCKFDESFFPIASDQIAPFNSQNTFISRRVLKDYFLYPHCGRMDDIWAAFYAQAKGHRVVFGKASVFQDRNVHDLTKDMKAEYLGYEHNHRMLEELRADPEAIRKYLPEKASRAFDLWRRHFA